MKLLARLALRGLARRPVTTAAVGILVFVAVAAVLSVALLQKGIAGAVVAGQERLGADISVIPRATEQEIERAMTRGEALPRFMDEQVAAALGTMPEIAEVVPKLVLPTSPSCCQMEIRYDVLGVPLARLRWVAGDPSVGENVALAGSEIDTAVAGKSLRIYNRQLHVAKVLPPTGTALDHAIYVAISVTRKYGGPELGLSLPPRAVSSIDLRVKPGHSLAALADRIERLIPQAQAVTSPQMFRSARVLLDQLKIVVVVAGAVTGILSIVAIGAISLLLGRTRQRELGILRALGARRHQMFSFVVVETALNAALGGLAGAATATLSAVFCERSLATVLPFLLSSPRWISGAAVVAVMAAAVVGAISSLAAATAAARLDPFEALRERA